MRNRVLGIGIPDTVHPARARRRHQRSPGEPPLIPAKEAFRREAFGRAKRRDGWHAPGVESNLVILALMPLAGGVQRWTPPAAWLKGGSRLLPERQATNGQIRAHVRELAAQ